MFGCERARPRLERPPRSRVGGHRAASSFSLLEAGAVPHAWVQCLAKSPAVATEVQGSQVSDLGFCRLNA